MFNINNIYSLIDKFLNNELYNNLEFEIRFKNIDLNSFNRLYDYLIFNNLEMNEINTKDIIFNDNNKKIRYTINFNNSDILCINKINLLTKNFDLFDINLSNENIIKKKYSNNYNNNKILLIRNKQRFRFYIYNKSIAIDLTIITVFINDNDTKILYEIECEILNEISINSIEKIYNIIYSNNFGILKIILNTKILYTNLQLNNFLKITKNIDITDILILDSLNSLNFKNNNWNISIKTNNIRKLLLFNDDGIWLYFPNKEISFLSDNKYFSKNILIDGEYSIENNIFYPINLIIYNSLNISNLKFSKKIKYLNTIINFFESLTINFLNFKIKLKNYDTFNSYDKLIKNISNNNNYILISENNNIFYKYEKYSIDLKFNLTTLDKMPYFTTYNYDLNIYEIFKGSKEYLFDNNLQILYEDFKNFSNGIIIEMYPLKINNLIYLKPKSIRNNKEFPNSNIIALKIWNLINTFF